MLFAHSEAPLVIFFVVFLKGLGWNSRTSSMLGMASFLRPFL